MFKKKESSFEEDIVNCKSFIYNIAWEDPEIDFKYLNIGSDDTILILYTAKAMIDGGKEIDFINQYLIALKLLKEDACS